jgi:hypothetical protein
MLSGCEEEDEAGVLLVVAEVVLALELELGFWDWAEGGAGPEAARWQKARRPPIWSWGRRRARLAAPRERKRTKP